MTSASLAKERVAKRSRTLGAPSSSVVSDVRLAIRKVLVLGISGLMARNSLKMEALATGFVYS